MKLHPWSKVVKMGRNYIGTLSKRQRPSTAMLNLWCCERGHFIRNKVKINDLDLDARELRFFIKKILMYMKVQNLCIKWPYKTKK